MLSADLDEEELDKRSAAIEIIAELQLTAEQLKVMATAVSTVRLLMVQDRLHTLIASSIS